MVVALSKPSAYELGRAKPLPVIPLSETEFYHTRIAFTRDAAGIVAGAVLSPGRWEQKETN